DDCVERYVGLLAEVPSVFTPGATYSYCNSGYVLLGRIIEVIDGQSWDESLRGRLTGPLATQTVTLPEEAILRRAAVGHQRCGNRAIVGHDGDTIGQSAYLRIDPEAGIAACLLTNSAESETLYREVFSEVFGDLTGVTMPPPPRPADGVPGSGSGPEASEVA